MAVYVYNSGSGDGWKNLSMDRYFLENLKPDDIMLYFYVNDRAVIIGKNQNAWKECNLKQMEDDGVQLVRRHTGGGAVFHDQGNLNFSFIMGEKNYDVSRQMQVIIDALEQFSLHAQVSGRNDILIEDKKFSGNAFAMNRGMCAHHGTLLINTDLMRLSKYLNVSEKKIRSKGIKSVRARVCNLADLQPDVTVERVREALIEMFVKEYGDAVEYQLDADAEKQVAEIYEQQASWQWRLGNSPKFDYEIYERFSFGEMQIMLSLQKAFVSEVQVFTDALDTRLADEVKELLQNVRFDTEELACALEKSSDAQIYEIAEYIRGLEL